ncbi:MAG: S8 family serine peptidase [Phycisphaeraceae bacterium]|nr:S8 family serine peptidase [Phycisphaeraceae bacterium]
MSNRVLCLAALAVAATSVAASPPATTGNAPSNLTREWFEQPAESPTRLIVRFDPFANRSEHAVEAILADAGVRRTVGHISLVPGLRVVEVQPGRVNEVAAKLRSQSGVLYATPDHALRACAQETPFGIAEVASPQAWPRWGKGAGVIVGHLDTGVDVAHPDLPTALAMESFVPGLIVDDFDYHGTHTAGTILARDNDFGVVGVAPEADIIVAKVLNNWQFGFNSHAILGLDWAVANGARVVNMSLGNSTFDQAYLDACNAAETAGVLLVASAGNLGNANPFYPAWFPSVMAISAVDRNDEFLSWTSYGPNISLAGPGESVVSTVPIVAWKVTWNNIDHSSIQLRGGTIDPYTGNAIYCGFGDSPAAFPPAVVGQIAHIRRGGNTIGEKVTNAWNAGAKAVVISNNVPGNFYESFTPHLRLPVCSISQADGDDLLANDGIVATINQYNNGHSYFTESGTSVSCPHVSGAAALLIGNFVPATGLPPIPPRSTRWVLEQTARQVGDPPRNDFYGWGIVDAYNASKYLHGRIRCPGDFNADDFVDDADFVIFASFYNDLLAPGGAYTGGDFNGDAFTDDSDFVTFAAHYDALLCP